MLEHWVMQSASLPAVHPGLSVCECGAAGSVSGQTACPVLPILHQSRSLHGHGSLLRPGAHLHPSYWSRGMFLFIYLVSDFLAIRFSVSSGCARRRSVSTYVAILVLHTSMILLMQFKDDNSDCLREILMKKTKIFLDKLGRQPGSED